MAARPTFHGVDLDVTLDAAAAHWQTLGEDALADEIARYRAAASAALVDALARGCDCASDEEVELADDEAPVGDADDDELHAGGAGDEGAGPAGGDAEGGACAQLPHARRAPVCCMT